MVINIPSIQEAEPDMTQVRLVVRFKCGCWESNLHGRKVILGPVF